MITTITIGTYTSYQYQSQYDIALQLYGSLDGLGNIIGSLPSLDSDVPAKTVIQFPIIPFKDAFFFNSNLIGTWTGSGSRLLETGSYRLLETGFKRLLE